MLVAFMLERIESRACRFYVGKDGQPRMLLSCCCVLHMLLFGVRGCWLGGCIFEATTAVLRYCPIYLFIYHLLAPFIISFLCAGEHDLLYIFFQLNLVCRICLPCDHFFP